MSSDVEISISCECCVRRGTPDCTDCLVSFVVGSTPEEFTLTSDEAAVVRLLSREGLVPRLRYRGTTPG